MPLKKNAKTMKNTLAEGSQFKADNGSYTERNWRSRRMPVQLIDFLVPDLERASQTQPQQLQPSTGGTSIVSNISPILSSGCDSVKEPKPVCFEPNDVDFPAVGTVRSKKIKTTSCSTVLQAAPLKPDNIANSTVPAPMPEKYNDNQKTVNKWLDAVEQPAALAEVQSQQLPRSVPQLAMQQLTFSAPSFITAAGGAGGGDATSAAPVTSATPAAPSPFVEVVQVQPAQLHGTNTPIMSAGVMRSAQRATQATQAIPATPATPATQAIPATPATPASCASSVASRSNLRRTAPHFIPANRSLLPTPPPPPPPPPAPSSLNVHSAPLYAVVPQSGRPILRTLSTYNAHDPRLRAPYRGVGRKDAFVTGTTRRYHERRMRREQQLPEELMMQHDEQSLSGCTEDASFVREFQQAVVNNSNPSTLELVSQSTLNWNAAEFRPRQVAGQTNSNLRSQPSQQSETRNSLSERRLRQRFNRTLKPGTLFELVSLPTEEPSSVDQAAAPSATIAAAAPRQQYARPNSNNNAANQSVFRLTSLPSTGIGTETDGESSGSGCVSGSNNNDRTLSTICGGSETQKQLYVQVQAEVETQTEGLAQHSPMLLDMDPSTQQTNASRFLISYAHRTGGVPPIQRPIGTGTTTTSTTTTRSSSSSSSSTATHTHNTTNTTTTTTSSSSHRKSTQPTTRHMLFCRGNKERHQIAADLNFMPPSIKKLYNLISGKYSDYAFVYALSAQLSQHCVPMECYVYLKMALLISLASIEPDELRAPISMCVICTDSCVAHRLLQSIGQLAPRFIGPHEGGQQPSFTALPARHTWVQASPLMMAQQGVYYAGDWNRLTRDQTEELEKCMENNSLPIPQLQAEQPLEAAIWTYWQPENATNQTTAFAKLCPIFGLPVYMDEQVNEVLWDFVLREHSRDANRPTKDALHIPIDDMRTLLELIQQRQVHFTQPAEHLLKKYYIISRVQQPTAFSSKTYVALKQFSESLAKLSMRLEVLETDVVVAIFHCEHFVRSIFGSGDMPPPTVSNFNVISRVDPYMNIFSRWLFQYLDCYEKKVV